MALLQLRMPLVGISLALGDRFLAHVERCRVLLHLIDGASDDAGAAYKTVRTELKACGHELAEKPEIVALNKADALGALDIERQVASLKRIAKSTPFVISAVSGQGVEAALRALMQFIDKARGDTAAPRSADVAWQP